MVFEKTALFISDIKTLLQAVLLALVLVGIMALVTSRISTGHILTIFHFSIFFFLTFITRLPNQIIGLVIKPSMSSWTSFSRSGMGSC